MNDSITQKGDQQSVNAALAMQAAAGDRHALAQLWELNKGLACSLARRWYAANAERAAVCGLAAEDLEQESYFAVLYAAETYAPEKGAFTTWLALAMRRQIMLAMCGGHRRNMTGEDGTRHTVASDMLNSCTSLDLPIADEGGDQTTLGALQEDPASAADLAAVEDRVLNAEMRVALDKAFTKLAAREAETLQLRYYQNKTQQAIGEEQGVSRSSVANVENKALKKLRINPELKRWHDEIIATHSFRNTGFKSWEHKGAIEERIVEFLDARGVYLHENAVKSAVNKKEST